MHIRPDLCKKARPRKSTSGSPPFSANTDTFFHETTFLAKKWIAIRWGRRSLHGPGLLVNTCGDAENSSLTVKDWLGGPTIIDYFSPNRHVLITDTKYITHSWRWDIHALTFGSSKCDICSKRSISHVLLHRAIPKSECTNDLYGFISIYRWINLLRPNDAYMSH